MSDQKVSEQTYQTHKLPTWCPGCGDYGIWMSLKKALSSLGYGTNEAAMVYGIGCHGNMYNWMKTYGFSSLHGRTLPVAQGIKLGNHSIPVIAVCGDGDGLGEGGNHFLHAARRNPDITMILHDNQVYGLTTGQSAPTAPKGFKSKSTPAGATDEPINPVALAITNGATFVARGFAGDQPHLVELIKQAIAHKGFSLVDILQPCVSFNKVNTYDWYRERVYTLDDSYTPDNKFKAYEKAYEWGEKIPTGVFYKEEKPTSEGIEPAIQNEILQKLSLDIPNFEEILTEFY
ncbi:thiamine pyrophosphate-dependent enzyme [Patescibacteria group bacterium]